MALSAKYMLKIRKSLSPLKVTLEYLMAYVTSPLGCLKGSSNSLCLKLNTWDAFAHIYIWKWLHLGS